MAKLSKTKSNDGNTQDKNLQENKPACSTKTRKEDREPEKASAPGCSMQSQLPGKQTERDIEKQIGNEHDKAEGGENHHDKPKKKRDKKPWSNNRNRSTAKRHIPEAEADAEAQVDAPQTQDTQSLDTPEAPVVASPALDPVGPDCHEIPKAETDREAMMRYLVNTHPRPNDFQCNVRVDCSPFTWFLHRQILQQCPFFAALFPPPGQPNNETDNVENDKNIQNIKNVENIDVIKLHGHVPEQLANVFHFMYFYTYPGADYDTSDPLVADSVLTNTAMYLAGASVGYQDMMYFAVRKIEAWSTAVLASDSDIEDSMAFSMAPSMESLESPERPKCPLQRAVQQHDGTMDYALLRLAGPLRRSLCIVYEQPLDVREGLLVALRLALVRIVDAVLPYLAANKSFRAHYRNEWTQPLFVAAVEAGTDDKLENTNSKKNKKTLAESVLIDHALFQDLGILRLPSADKRATAATATAANTTGGNATTPPKRTPSIAYLFHLLNRLSNIEVWSTHASIAQKATIATANGGDDRRDRDGRGDAGDDRGAPWRLRLGEAMREHNQIMRELDDCLVGFN